MKIRNIAAVLILLLFHSCSKEYDKPRWDVSVIGPLVQAEIGIGNLIADSITSIQGDGSVHILYERSFYDFNLDSIYEVPDTIIPKVITWPFVTSTINPGFPFFSNNNNVLLGLSGVSLNELRVRSGIIRVEMINTLPSKIIYTYTIPGAVKNGTALTFTQTVDEAGPGGPGRFIMDIDLSGYSVNLKGSTNSSFNTIYYNVQAVSDPSGTAFTVNFNDTVINIMTSIIDMEPSYARGYLGQNFIRESSSENIGIGGLIKDGMIKLDSMNLDIFIDNYIGADARIKFNFLESVNSRSSASVPLNAPTMIGNVININRAIENPVTGQAPIKSSRVFSLNNSNSNLISFIENIPDRINYEAEIEFNPLGNISSYNDFVYSDYLVEGRMKLSMPLRFAAENLMLADTQKMELGTFTDFDNAGETRLKLIVENGFPFDIELQLFVLDEQRNITDSLLGPGLVRKANTDLNYIAVSPILSEFDVFADSRRRDILKNGKYLGIRGRFNTPDYSQLIQIYSHYKLKLRLTGDGIYSIR
ncbi:MAG: hypothetical protein DWQ44_03140 [Bacteroidetes bacterium]|nr:MAG: hypothetical protein DWQ33_04665 [Bacteroidota bacterium]REK00003.1 MAG: hypothetical protein DWQ39_13935 [Bacteroidota bacterium]REK35818.1 MAG: hypothetical protein DWQ44_03140 [Bacteroidota bacterium]REK49311.1 MAG: hypothetical protein DWQ48_07715 [Bacteroidota bacterium]